MKTTRSIQFKKWLDSRARGHDAGNGEVDFESTTSANSITPANW